MKETLSGFFLAMGVGFFYFAAEANDAGQDIETAWALVAGLVFFGLFSLMVYLERGK